MQSSCEKCERALWSARCSVCGEDQQICSYCAWKNTAYQACCKCHIEWTLSETKSEEDFRLLVLDLREIHRTSSDLGFCKDCEARLWIAPCNMCRKNSLICPTCSLRGVKYQRCPYCQIDWTYAVCKTVDEYRLSILSTYRPEPLKVAQECPKRVPVAKPTNSDHCAFGIDQDDRFSALPNDNATKPHRVEAPGDKTEKYRQINGIDDVPARYKEDRERFDQLAYDPDQRAPNPREAMAGLAAESQGLVAGPIVRAGKGLEFYDAHGIPYDVKAPVSPPSGEGWKFNAESVSRTIIQQLTVKVRNNVSKEIQHVRVLLDTTYLNAEDHRALWMELNSRASDDPEMLNLVIELNVEFD